jgi:hypothetical protein
VVILEIDVDGVFPIERKRNPQVARYGDGKSALPIAAERMKLPSGNVHVPRARRCIQPIDYSLYSRPMRRGNSLACTRHEASGEPLVAKRADHAPGREAV